MLRSMIVTAGAGALFASTAAATPVFVGFIEFRDSYGSTGGGEFRATGKTGWSIEVNRTGTAFQGGIASAPGMFETFCLEDFENLPFEVTNYKADINTETVAQASAYAGGNHGGFNDALDPRTAYLYHHFLAGTLATPYDYVNEANRIDDANAMQTAIWFIEQERTDALSGKALALFNEADAAVTSGAWVGLGNVRVLNIYTNTARADYQDVIVELVTIPLPTGAAMAGVGLAGLGLVRRRK
ncbi:MAG TPA: VPLPA-CTERM sorting domain-containing protein [Phycisphaerales bacterium]|nr:VPLPA-CTERM sorting domain-containing protein [Phycisphaerales bacterium]